MKATSFEFLELNIFAFTEGERNGKPVGRKDLLAALVKIIETAHSVGWVVATSPRPSTSVPGVQATSPATPTPR
jgi:hypothetical protein